MGDPRGFLKARHVGALVLAHLLETLGQVADLVLAGAAKREIIVAALHFLGSAHESPDRPRDTRRNDEASEQRDGGCDAAESEQPRLDVP